MDPDTVIAAISALVAVFAVVVASLYGLRRRTSLLVEASVNAIFHLCKVVDGGSRGSAESLPRRSETESPRRDFRAMGRRKTVHPQLPTPGEKNDAEEKRS